MTSRPHHPLNNESNDTDVAMPDAISSQASKSGVRLARNAILEGYRDVIAGRVVTYTGDLRSLLRDST